MENETNESQLQKIRALLAKAEKTDFPAEAKAYTEKAMVLMAKWGIDQSLLEAKQMKSDIVDRVIDIPSPFARDKVTLLFRIASALGGRTIWLKGNAKTGGHKMHVFATETDLARIDMIFTSLLVQCSSAMNNAVDVSYEAQRRPRRFKSDFLYGFSQEVGYRLSQAETKAAKEAESAAEAQGTSTDLVLRTKKDRVDERVESIYKNLTTSRRTSREIGSGYGHGVDAGKRANIGDKKAAQSALVG